VGCYNIATKMAAQARLKAMRATFLEHLRRKVGRFLASHFPPPEAKQRGGKKRPHFPESPSLSTDWSSLARDLERECGIPDDSLPLSEMLSTMPGCKTNKAREAVATKIAKRLHQRLDGNELMAHGKTNVDQLLEICSETLQQGSPPSPGSLRFPKSERIVLALSASYLWELRFSKDKQKREVFRRILEMGETHPAG